MDWLKALVSNPFLVAGVGSWFVAQVMKTVIHAIINKKFIWERLFGDGGMPSGHSATVTAMCVMSALFYGLGSFQFAVSGILAIIVCHDATGVRRETEKQAFLIDELVKAVEELAEDNLPEVKLKKFVGHSPIQVIAGILLGCVNAIIMYFILF